MSKVHPQIFEAEYYSLIHQTETVHWWSKSMTTLTLSMLRQYSSRSEDLKMVDVGCGTGFMMDSLKRLSCGEEPFGVDISAYAIRYCKERGLKNVVEASATDIPFEDAYFDLCVSLDVLQHVSPAGADRIAIKEFARIIKKDGILFLRTNSALLHMPRSGSTGEHYRRYLRGDLCQMLQAEGFTVQRATYLNAAGSLYSFARELAGWLLRRPDNMHALGPGLAIDCNSKTGLKDAVMCALMAVEIFAITRLGFNVPFGHSIAIVAKRC